MMVTLNFLPSISSIGESILCLIKKKKREEKERMKECGVYRMVLEYLKRSKAITLRGFIYIQF